MLKWKVEQAMKNRTAHYRNGANSGETMPAPSFLIRVISMVSLACLLLLAPGKARADIGYAPDSKAVPVIAGVVAVVGGLIFVSYLVLRTPRTTGCVVSTPTGLSLQSDRSDRETYQLNDPGGVLKSGERVRIVGKRKGAAGRRTIAVSKLSKIYGSCSVPPPARFQASTSAL